MKANVIYLRPYIEGRRAVEAANYERRLEAARAAFVKFQAEKDAANAAIAEIDSHDCRITRTQSGPVEHITTETCWDESGCSAGAGAAPLDR